MLRLLNISPFERVISGIAFLILLLLPSSSFGQYWWESIGDQEANFYAIQEKAKAYFDSVGTGKGTGWKAYTRWEYYWQDRVKFNGDFPDPVEKLEEIHNFRARQEGRRGTASTGNWTNLGPYDVPNNGTGQPNGLGRINCLAFHPTDSNILFAGAPSGGIWKSVNGGTSWSDLNNVNFRLGVSSIVVHPNHPDTLFIGTGDRDGGDAPGYGVYWSTDGGDTWSARNNGMGNRTVYEILMDPNFPDTLIASTASRIYRSTDGGASWTQSFTGHSCKDLAFNPSNKDTIYAAGSNFYISANNGISFSQVTSGVPGSVQRMAIATTPVDPNYVYLLAGNSSGYVGLYRSINRGQSFSLRSSSPNILGYDGDGNDAGSQAWYDLVLAADPTSSGVMYAGGINIWKSTNGGSSWSPLTHWYGGWSLPALHADQHALEFSPHNGNLFNGNDGGIAFTTDGGNNWSDISSGLDIAQVYKIGQSATNKDLIINGYQDNGTAFYNNGSWYTEIGGDGMECIIDPTDPDVMYGALYYGDIRRSTNGGLFFNGITSGISETGAWVTPYKLHPNYPDTMFAGFENIWRTYECKSEVNPLNVNWTSITSHANSTKISDLSISPANDNLMFYARGNSLYRSNNVIALNPSWTDLTSSLPQAGVIRDIETHPFDENKLWIALSGNIYYSSNQGSSWSDYSGSLPNITLNSIVFDTSSLNDGLYIGMDEGVYYRDSTMSDWTLFNSGLASVEITELEIFYDNSGCFGQSKIRASTYGRGLWESDLADPGNLAPVACFTVNTDDIICAGKSIQLEDQSSFGPNTWSWSISPSTFSYANGSSSSSQNPKVIFSVSDTYTITLSVSNENGSDNHSQVHAITVTPLINSFPVYENFEEQALCDESPNCEITTCPLDGNNWNNLTTDEIDWRVYRNVTPSSGTGPTMDYDPGSESGNYAYLEASNSCTFKTAILECNCISLAGYSDAFLSLAYHMQGTNMGDLFIDVYANGSWINGVAQISGNQGPLWNVHNQDLSVYLDDTISLRIRGVTGNGYESDIAIDAINLNATGTLLPIETLVFNGQALPNGFNELNWTGLESETDHSAVVESGIQGTFIQLSETIEVKDHNREYTFIDQSPSSVSPSYYRLRVTRHDGSIYYSNVVTIKPVQSVEQFSVIPNPFSESITISISSAQSVDQEIALIDGFGRVIQRKSLPVINGHGVIQWHLNELPPGFYFIRWGERQHKVVKIY